MVSILFFILCLVLFSATIFYRLWEIRIGRFNIEDLKKKEVNFSIAHIETINNKFLEILRHSAHLLVMIVVRIAIEALFIIRRESRRLSTKLDHMFLSGNVMANKGSVSFFLRDIAEYKDKIKNMVPKKGE